MNRDGFPDLVSIEEGTERTVSVRTNNGGGQFFLEALATEDCNVDQWQVIRADHGRRKTPDGTLDRFLVRYQDTHGRVAFTNGKQSRTCDVLLQGSRVVWTVFRGM